MQEVCSEKNSYYENNLITSCIKCVYDIRLVWQPSVYELPIWKAILISWGIAFFEYCLMVPANRIGFLDGNFSAFQLKIIQEVITLVLFAFFAVFYLKQHFEWRYLISFGFILGAVYFAFKK